MPRVAIVEDHLLLAETLRAALEHTGVQARVVAAAGSPAELLADLRAQSCDLVLLDLDLGSLGDATPLVAPLVRDGMRVLLVTGSEDRMAIAAALEQGAIGYQPKMAGFGALLARATEALTATAPLDPHQRVLLLNELAIVRAARQRDLSAFDRLTDREAATLRALARGQSVADIAANWFVSPTTVRSHVRAVLAKLQVASQLAAVAAAVRTGWFIG